MTITLAVFTLACTFATQSARCEITQDDKEGRQENQQIVATWTVVAAVHNGKDSESNRGDIYRFEKDGTYIRTLDPGMQIEGTYKVTRNGDDWWIAMETEEDKPEFGGAGPRLGILKAEINKEMKIELTICIATSGGLPRPDEFDSPKGKHRLLLTFVKAEN